MIQIHRQIADEIFLHAKRARPVEACGYLAGKGNVVTELFPMKNLDESSTHFTMDPAEQFKILKETRNKGLDIIAIYHSHPDTPARPSDEDIRLAFDPNISYVIASLVDNSIKSFKIKENKSEVEKIEFLD